MVASMIFVPYGILTCLVEQNSLAASYAVEALLARGLRSVRASEKCT